jgi:TetR/AcrR family transcriptional repressor of lmrAB and yxaGH operons
MSTAREHIIEATCALLEVQGYHATGLNEIIQKSGSPKGSLYHYFPGGKEALTEEALVRVGQIVETRIREFLAETDSAAEAIPAFLMNLAQQIEASGYRAGGPITTVALETASTSDRLREACDNIYQGWQAAFADKLTQSGFDHAAGLSTLIIAAIEGAIILCRTQRSPKPMQAVAEQIGILLRCPH